MLEEIEASLERFRIHFDSFERQSVVESEAPEAIALLETYEEDGALWARTSAHGDDKDRVVVRSNGEATYFAVDAAYIRRKYARGFDRLIYVLGADHHGYVARLQALAEMLGHPRDSVEVLIYQLVNLTRGGEAARMSKRRGDVVFLDEFLDEIGVDAARWYLLSRGHDQTIEIDVDLAAERSQKNPVYYVQYAHARIAGVLRNAEGPRPTRARRRRSRRRSARSSSASSSCPTSSVRPRHGGRRTRSRPTRSAWRTTSTASTTSTRCSAPRRRPSGSRSARPRSRRGDVPRPARDRGARAHVTAGLTRRSHDRAMRWNLALGALAASWGFIAVLAAAVDLGAEALAFWRLALAAATLALVALATRGRTGSPRGAVSARSRPWASCRAPTGCSSSRPSSTARWRSPS